MTKPPDLTTAIGELVRIEIARAIENAAADPDPWLTKTGAARHASVSVSKIDHLIRTGELKVGRAGRDPRIRRSEIDRYLERRDSDRSEVDRAVDAQLQEVIGG